MVAKSLTNACKPIGNAIGAVGKTIGNVGSSTLYYTLGGVKKTGGRAGSYVRDKGTLFAKNEAKQIEEYTWPAVQEAADGAWKYTKKKIGNAVDVVSTVVYENRFGLCYRLLPAPSKYVQWLEGRDKNEAVDNVTNTLAKKLHDELYERNRFATDKMSKAANSTKLTILDSNQSFRKYSDDLDKMAGPSFESRPFTLPARIEDRDNKTGEKLSKSNAAAEAVYNAFVRALLVYVKGSDTPVKGSYRGIMRTVNKADLTEIMKKARKGDNRRMLTTIRDRYEKEKETSISRYLAGLKESSREEEITKDVERFDTNFELALASAQKVTEAERFYQDAVKQHANYVNQLFRPLNDTDASNDGTVNAVMKFLKSLRIQNGQTAEKK